MIKLKAFVKPEGIKTTEPASKRVAIPKWVEIKEKLVDYEIKNFYVVYYNELGKSRHELALTLKDAIQMVYLKCGLKPEDWRVVDE